MAVRIWKTVADIQEHVNDDSIHANRLRQLISYVRRQWTNKHSVGPERLSVHDNHSPTNKVLESYNAALRRRTKVSHPNLYSFLGRLQDYVRITATVSFSVRVIVSGGAAGEFNRRRYFYQSVISMKPIWAGGCINKKTFGRARDVTPRDRCSFSRDVTKRGLRRREISATCSRPDDPAVAAAAACISRVKLRVIPQRLCSLRRLSPLSCPVHTSALTPPKQEAQLSLRGRALLGVIEYFAKSLEVTRNDTLE